MTTPRQELAEMLKDARLDAGFRSQAALAHAMHVTRPVVSKAESPTQPVPSDDVLKAWIRVTRADRETVMEVVGRCKSSTPEWFMPYLGAESAATVVRVWQPLAVPGLFQTENYARTQLTIEGYTGEQLEDLLTTRLRRQAIIGRTRIIAAIDAAVLQRCMGSPRIMAEQCGHIS